MNSRGAYAVDLELFRQAVCSVFGRVKDQHLAPLPLPDQLRKEFPLTGANHRMNDLRYQFHRTVLLLNLDKFRVVEQSLRKTFDLFRVGGRKEQVLALLVGAS